jgi:uncharacterized membrane protein
LEELVKAFIGYVASAVEGIAALFIAVGALESIYLLLVGAFRKGPDALGWASLGSKKWAWLHFARWLVLALEFELAADILRTALSPTWNDIGQLAAIAAIRTFLNYFLEKDAKEAMAFTREVTENARSSQAHDDPRPRAA